MPPSRLKQFIDMHWSSEVHSAPLGSGSPLVSLVVVAVVMKPAELSVVVGVTSPVVLSPTSPVVLSPLLVVGMTAPVDELLSSEPPVLEPEAVVSASSPRQAARERAETSTNRPRSSLSIRARTPCS